MLHSKRLKARTKVNMKLILELIFGYKDRGRKEQRKHEKSQLKIENTNLQVVNKFKDLAGQNMQMSVYM